MTRHKPPKSWREAFHPRVVARLDAMRCPHGHDHAWQCVGCKRWAMSGDSKWLEWGR